MTRMVKTTEDDEDDKEDGEEDDGVDEHEEEDEEGNRDGEVVMRRRIRVRSMSDKEHYGTLLYAHSKEDAQG